MLDNKIKISGKITNKDFKNKFKINPNKSNTSKYKARIFGIGDFIYMFIVLILYIYVNYKIIDIYIISKTSFLLYSLIASIILIQLVLISYNFVEVITNKYINFFTIFKTNVLFSIIVFIVIYYVSHGGNIGLEFNIMLFISNILFLIFFFGFLIYKL